MACGGFMYTVRERRFPVGDPLPSAEFANHVAQMVGRICEASGSLPPRFRIENTTFVATGDKSRAILERVLPQAVSMTAHALLAIQEGRKVEFQQKNNRLQMAVQL